MGFKEPKATTTDPGLITLAGDITTPATAPVVVKIQTKTLASSLSTIGATQDGYVLTWVNANSDWEAKPGSGGGIPSGSAGGDLSGTYPNPTVAKVDGVSYPASPSTNTVPVVTGTNTITYQQVADAQVSSTAAIAVNKLAAGTSAQVLLNNATPVPTWTTVGGDASIDSSGNVTNTIARGLKSATTTVSVSGATAPISGQILTATSSTAATWQTPASSGGLTAPVTGTVRTNIGNSSYTIDTTGGGSDYTIIHNNMMTTSLSGTFGVTNGSQLFIPTSFQVQTLTSGSTIVFNNQAGVTYTIANLPNNLAGGSTFQVTNASTSVSATGSLFSTQVTAGDFLLFNTSPFLLYKVSSVGGNTSITLSANYGPAAGNTSVEANAYDFGQSTIALTGTVTTNGTTTITGSGTSFASQLTTNSYIIISNQTTLAYQVAAIASNTSLTLGTAFTGTSTSGLTVQVFTGQFLNRAYTGTTNASTGASTSLDGYVSVTNGSQIVTSLNSGITNFTTANPLNSGSSLAGSMLAFDSDMATAYSVLSTPQLTLTGTVTTTTTSASVSGSSTLFTLQINQYDFIQFSSQLGVAYKVLSIQSDTSLTLQGATFTIAGASGLTAVNIGQAFFNLTGVITTSSSSTSVSGSGTFFTKQLKVGDFIAVPSSSNGAGRFAYQIASITNDTSLTLTSACQNSTTTGSGMAISVVTSTAITLASNYTGATSTTAAITGYYYGGPYILPAPTSGRELVIKDATGFAEISQLNIFPHGNENIENQSGLSSLFSITTSPLNSSRTVINPASLNGITFTNSTTTITASAAINNIIFPGTGITFLNATNNVSPRVVTQVTGTTTFIVNASPGASAGGANAVINTLIPLNGTFNTTNSSTTVTASQSQNGILVPGARIIFTTSSGVVTPTASASYSSYTNVISSISSDGKTIILSANFGSTNTGVRAFADLGYIKNILQQGNLIQFAGDSASYTLANSLGTNVVVGQFSVTNGSNIIALNIDVISNSVPFTIGTILTFTSQPGVLYCIDNYSASNTITIKTYDSSNGVYSGPTSTATTATIISYPILILTSNYAGTTGPKASLQTNTFAYKNNYGALKLFSDGDSWWQQ